MINLYNTLTRSKEKFTPISPAIVGLYTCGPTVYNYAHLGNLRSYIFEDVLKRVLIYNNYQVKHVMNVTDVGHLTSDADTGEDKMEKGARRENKTAWEVAEFYTGAFKDDLKKLNILEPDVWCKATDNIPEQIALIKKLEEKEYTYQTGDGIYFDTSKFKDYNKLSHLDLKTLEEGARVEKNAEKKNPTDFALWKFSSPNTKRQMEWESPWGVGFPGWHIECSAMSMKFLKDNLDIHCGGIDHINVHHTNEIAQSEAATGKKFFNYWMHGAFLNIAGGKKMAKSEDNFLTVENALIKKNINPLAYRFAALGTHYRKPMEYSEDGIKNAENGLEHLYSQIKQLSIISHLLLQGGAGVGRQLSIGDINKNFKERFLEAINDDLNMPRALAVAQEVLKSKLDPEKKLATIFDFDRVLGLNLNAVKKEKNITEKLKNLIEKRKKARVEKNWREADELRKEIEQLGYIVEDQAGLENGWTEVREKG